MIEFKFNDSGVNNCSVFSPNGSCQLESPIKMEVSLHIIEDSRTAICVPPVNLVSTVGGTNVWSKTNFLFAVSHLAALYIARADGAITCLTCPSQSTFNLLERR